MSYCPRCFHEYAETVTVCVECGTPLKRGNRPVSRDLALDDLIVPVGAVVFGAIALLMLYARLAAQFGWISGPLARLITLAQPPCMTVFLAFVVVASAVVLAGWLIQTLVRKR